MDERLIKGFKEQFEDIKNETEDFTIEDIGAGLESVADDVNRAKRILEDCIVEMGELERKLDKVVEAMTGYAQLVEEMLTAMTDTDTEE